MTKKKIKFDMPSDLYNEISKTLKPGQTIAKRVEELIEKGVETAHT
jgi:hypothetical protein